MVGTWPPPKKEYFACKYRPSHPQGKEAVPTMYPGLSQWCKCMSIKEQQQITYWEGLSLFDFLLIVLMKSKKRASVWCRHFLDTWRSPGSVWSRVPGRQQSADTSPCLSSLFTACPLWLPSVYCGRGQTATYCSAIKSPFQIKSSLKGELMWINLFVKNSTDGTWIGQNCERGLRMILARFLELRNGRPSFWGGALPLKQLCDYLEVSEHHLSWP